MSNFWNVTNSGVNNLHMGDNKGGTVNTSGTATIQFTYNISAIKSEFEDGLGEVLRELRNNPDVSMSDLSRLAEQKAEISAILKAPEEKQNSLADKVSTFADTLRRIVESVSSAEEVGGKFIALVSKAAPVLITGVSALASYFSH